METAALSGLVLIRHAMPMLDQTVPPERWQLGDDGRAAARAITAVLPGLPRYWLASEEPKAYQTAETIAQYAGDGPVVRDVRVGEVQRPPTWTDNYRQLARAYLEGSRHPGWEPHAAVSARFEAAIATYAIRAAAAGRTLSVVTHGLAPTVWLIGRIGLSDPGNFWASLSFPDAVVVDLTKKTVRKLRPFAGPTPGRSTE